MGKDQNFLSAMLPSLSLASASAFVVSPTRMPAHAAPRLGAVRCEPSLFNFGMGADVVKIQFIQRLFTDFVGFDGGAQFEVEDDYVTQANHSATLLLMPDRKPAETASLVPFVTAQHECKVRYGAILFQWWRVAIVVLLVQRAVFVVAKLLLTTNGREMYKKK